MHQIVERSGRHPHFADGVIDFVRGTRDDTPGGKFPITSSSNANAAIKTGAGK
jgi:hypothetical protein